MLIAKHEPCRRSLAISIAKSRGSASECNNARPGPRKGHALGRPCSVGCAELVQGLFERIERLGGRLRERAGHRQLGLSTFEVKRK